MTRLHRAAIRMLFLLFTSAAFIFNAGNTFATDASAKPGSGDRHAGGAAGDTAAASTIMPGTAITRSNWRQFKDFMPEGMIDLFEGSYFWKMPADVEMDVGPTIINPLPKGYLEATEKYSSQIKLVPLPDGGLTIAGYQGGVPFPHPSGPNRGWQILANFWFRYIPHLVVNTPDNLGFACTLDSFGSVGCTKSLHIYRPLE